MVTERPRYPRRAVLGGLAALPAVGLWRPESARAATLPFPEWLEELRVEALAEGVSLPTVQAALRDVEPIPRVIELDRRQPEGRWTLDRYLQNIVPASRQRRAAELHALHRPLLDEVEAAYGVPGRYLVALWGIETSFGGNTGGFQIIPALATLAHDGRRSAFFRGELLNALRIIDQGHIALPDMTGSWAGAMGQCQFMPSSFLNFAVDHDGDGRRDIWNSLPDVFASSANYLSRNGWIGDEIWGREVRLTEPVDEGMLDLDHREDLASWQRRGVRRPDGGDLPTVAGMEASLIRPDGEGGRAFLVYENFRVLLRWNRSTYFAIAVGLLADAALG